MLQTLLLFAGLAAIFSIVPAVVLVSTGSLRETWIALKGYAVVWLIIGGTAALLGGAELVGSIVNS